MRLDVLILMRQIEWYILKFESRWEDTVVQPKGNYIIFLIKPNSFVNFCNFGHQISLVLGKYRDLRIFK
jgi:hypothetical protein